MPIHRAASVKSESGFTLIDLLFTASLICTLATMALPALMRARGAAQSASAVGTVRVVNSSQLSFAVTCGSGFYSPDFITLGLAPPSSPTAFLPPELSGATFSVTNLGMYGVTSLTAVINPPQAAILGVGKMEPRAVVRDGEVVARNTLSLTISCDHRILSGAPAAEFLARVKDILEQPISLAL